jgi:serine/threonine-protein kinase
MPTFVMEEEFIEGPTLREKIDRGENGLEFGIRVADVLLDLLVQFEELNIIHRDIKPNNIMLNEEDEIILLDIGMVRFEERESITPDHLDRLGTAEYGAPEQLDYDKDLQSIRTDIFSTGIVMFETITGVHPYSNTGKSISESILEGEKMDFTGILDDEDLSQEISDVFEIMTSTEPHMRYRKPEFVREDFDGVKEVVLDV